MSDATDSTTHVPWQELLTARYISPLLLVTLTVLLHAADSTLIATLSPAIVQDLDGVHLISWAVSLYEVGTIVAASASGLLSRQMGLSRSMTCAALVFAGGCLLSAFAPTMWWLLGGRALQGLGGGGMVALSFVAVGVLFPSRLMPRALAVVSMVWGASAFLGPLLGGVFDATIGWRWAFGLFATLAVGLSLWIYLSPVKHTPTSTTSPSMPVVRLICLTLGVLLIATASIQTNWLLVLLLVSAGLLTLFGFLRLDARHTTHRMLPKRAGDPFNPIGGALLMILCFGMSTIAITIYGPLLMTRLYGLSALSAGYVVALASIGWSIAAIVFSGVREQYDHRMIRAGMVTLAISIIGFLTFMPHGPVSLIAACALLEGAGFGMAWAFILRRATALVEYDDIERIASSIATVHRLGYALGAAMIGIVANVTGLGSNDASQSMVAMTDDAVRHVATWIFVAGLPMAAIGFFGMVIFTRRPSATTQ